MNPSTLTTTTPAQPPPQTVAPARGGIVHAVRWLFSLNNRFLAPILITCILLAVQLKYSLLEGVEHTGLAILTSMAMELILGRLVLGKWPHLASAYISGISVGILIRAQVLWPYILCSAIAIVSKYAIRIGGRHIWNPSNLSVSLMLFLAPFYVAALGQQWGNDNWPLIIIWCLGGLILYNLGRLHISLTYVLSFVFFAYIRALLTGNPFQAEVAPITGPVYQLFICFMITDPKTTTRRVWSQCLVVFLVAAVEAVIRLKADEWAPSMHLAVHAPYYALFIVGPIANLIEIALTRPGRKAGVVPTA
jgi:hypothetical protein